MGKNPVAPQGGGHTDRDESGSDSEATRRRRRRRRREGERSWRREEEEEEEGENEKEEDEEGKPFFHPALPELVGGGLGPACGTTQQFDDPAFQPHQPYGSCSKEEWHDSLERYKFNIIDKLQLPDLEPGEYVLSFRWDCEQSPQIWSGCSDITIKSSYDIFP